MDSVTQAVLGGAIQGALLGKHQGRRSLIFGAALATLPDLDVVIKYADPVSSMTFHRGFSHSVFTLTALAALLAWLIRKCWPAAPYSGRRLFLTLWLVLVTHPVLDAFTVYGTQLFWPLTFTPQSWAAIFIVDPVYTVPLALTVLIALLWGPRERPRRWLAGALAFSSAYLLFGLGVRTLAEHRVERALRESGVQVQALRGVPMPLNTLVWRVIAKTPDGDYVDAISGLFDTGQPEWIRRSRHLPLAAELRNSPLHERLRWFTDDWLRYDAVGDALVVSDLRMGVPGQYTFRFKFARCESGRWIPETPSNWYGDQPGMPELRQLLHRIGHQQPPLPLESWARRFSDVTVPSAGCPAAPA